MEFSLEFKKCYNIHFLKRSEGKKKHSKKRERAMNKQHRNMSLKQRETSE